MRDEQTIFNEALEKSSAEERARFIEQACADDAEMLARIQMLLEAHERAGEFLESPPTSLRPENIEARERIGSMIGPYKLLEQIGEGGMGVVYMAEQTRPVRRRVALKIIKPGLDTRQVIARFEAERQALAMMDHPNIAKVFDAGGTETGRSYFVMELVRGIPITDYCDQHQLTPRQRLELFVQVCQAVQHAHQKGIIHRDLKPNNVLVTLTDDGKPVPKVIDFGIAKATTGQPLTDLTLFTQFRQLIGTPLYMSPEQAETSALADVDTRSDVYSLGVLLYELLTGTTPFDKERLAKAAFDEVRRIIREEEPPRPSTRVSTLGDTLTMISASRASDPRKLSHTIRGELDWIVMKALEKDRARRYETANGLARDIERYLADEAVEACPPSKIYRLRKTISRNKTALAMSGALVMVLLIATTVSSWQAVRATRFGREATRQQKLATEEAERQLAMRQFLFGIINGANPRGPLSDGRRRGRDVTVLESLNAAVQTLDQGSLAGRPEIEWSVRHNIALAYAGLGEKKAAETQWRAALRASEKVPDIHPEVVLELKRQVANQLDPKAAEGEALIQENLAYWRGLPGNHPDQIAVNLVSLANIFRARGKLPEAEQAAREALAVREAADGKDNLLAAWPVGTLAKILHVEGKLPEAEAMYRRGFAIVDSASQDAPSRDLTGVAIQLDWFCRLLEQEGKIAEAQQSRRRILSIQRRWYPEESAQVAAAFSSLLRTLHKEGKTGDARSLCEEAVRIRQTEIQAAHAPERRAALWASLYRPLMELGETAQARTACRKAQELSPTTTAEALNDIAWEMVSGENPDRSDVAMAVELGEKIVDVIPEEGTFWNTLGVARYRASQWDKAVEALERSRQLQKEKFFAWDAFFLAMAHWHLGQHVEAKNWYEQACAWISEQRLQNNDELISYRAEAAAVLGIESPPTTRPAAATANSPATRMHP